MIRPIRAIADRLNQQGGQKHNVRTKRRRNKVMQWVLYSPRNALMTGLTVGGVVALAFGVWLTQTVYSYQVAQYERAVAAASSPTATTGVGGFGQYGPLANADATPTEGVVAAAPVPQGTPTTSAPTATPTPTSTVVTAPKSAAEASAEATARSFINAWLAGPKAASTEAWLAGLKPYAAPSLIELFKLTDRSRIPTSKITGMTSVTVPGTNTAHVSAAMEDRGTLAVVLETNAAGKWEVVDIAPEEQG